MTELDLRERLTVDPAIDTADESEADDDDETPIEHDEPLPDEVRDGDISQFEGDEP